MIVIINSPCLPSLSFVVSLALYSRVVLIVKNFKKASMKPLHKHMQIEKRERKISLMKYFLRSTAVNFLFTSTLSPLSKFIFHPITMQYTSVSDSFTQSILTIMLFIIMKKWHSGQMILHLCFLLHQQLSLQHVSCQ